MVLLGLFQNTAKQLSKAPERMFKVVLAGDAAVGKSSLIMRLCKGKFVSNLSSTLGKLHLCYLTSTAARFAFCVFPCMLCLCRLSVYYYYYYSRTSLSRTRLFRITAYLEVKIWSLF